MADINDHDIGNYGLLAISNIDNPRFSEQTDLIKSSGAAYDGASKTWWLQLEQALAGDEPGINALFAAAKEYGTYVVLQERK